MVTDRSLFHFFFYQSIFFLAMLQIRVEGFKNSLGDGFLLFKHLRMVTSQCYLKNNTFPTRVINPLPGNLNKFWSTRKNDFTTLNKCSIKEHHNLMRENPWYKEQNNCILLVGSLVNWSTISSVTWGKTAIAACNR